MPEENYDSRSGDLRPNMSWLSDGIALSHRVLVVALAMSLPVLLGYVVDRWTGAKFPAGVLVGSLFGMLCGCWQLWGLMRWLENRNQAGKLPKSPPGQVSRSDLKPSESNTSEQADD